MIPLYFMWEDTLRAVWFYFPAAWLFIWLDIVYINAVLNRLLCRKKRLRIVQTKLFI